VQTWLPQIGYADSMRMLDTNRLRKQRNDCWHILQMLESLPSNPQAAGNRHALVFMWKGHERSLCLLGIMACYELRIGRREGCDLYPKLHKLDNDLKAAGLTASPPPWLHDLDVHRAYRSNLIRVNDGYAPLWPGTPERMPYLFPQVVDTDPRGYRLRLLNADIQRLESGERKLPDWLWWDNNKRQVLGF